MSKLFVIGALTLGIAGYAFAAIPAVPEIDGSSAVTAVTLLCGAITVVRARRKK